MKLSGIITLLALCLLTAPHGACAQESPINVNLYYNNYTIPGQVMMVNGNPYLSIDSIRTLFPRANISDSGKGTYMVNGKAVNIYHYYNHLYLDTGQFAGALNLVPKYIREKLEIVFVDKREQVKGVSVPENPPIRMEILTRKQGVSSEPVNSVSQLFRVSLVNVSQKPYVLNYYDILLIGTSGSRYASINNMKYEIVYGDNTLDSRVMLSPGQKQVVIVTFNIPPGDSPKYLVIFQNSAIQGYSRL
ncbi:MAG: hypothetical protein RDV48_00745 [Candidatus Eremiobacteraeota bacterium]|nr:hypothetical protein [Candidatus Eremiobacteraeota bacterium]